jgi:hypothetical protein
MSDSYQAIYDAVRSRISGGNIGEVIADVCRNAFDISHMKARLQQDFSIAAQEMARPCVLFKPEIKNDHGTWEAILGDIWASGATPAEAMANFDQVFWKGTPKHESAGGACS